MKHTIELRPFTGPNFARQAQPVGGREDGWKETPAIPAKLIACARKNVHGSSSQSAREICWTNVDETEVKK